MKRFTVLFSILIMFGFLTACDDDPKKEKTEICDNAIDDDGDTLVDCDDVDDCATAANCQTPVEICDDTIDNDGDGDIDCDDADCAQDPACFVSERFLTVIGTSDLHSHLMGVGPARDYSPLVVDEDGTKSGLARHAAIIKSIKAEKEAAGIPYVLVDSGDSLMGDMVDLLSGDAPPVFHFFQLMNYDTVMLGNHDWDWTPAGTAVIINAAMTGVAFDRPLLCSNLVTDATATGDDYIEQMVAGGIIQRYVLKTIDDDFTVGIFGLMGIEADSNVPQAKPVTFWHEDPAVDGGFAPIQDLVDEIRTAGANLVIHAGHAGINTNAVGEDRDVAANVTGIDVIMSGHRHQLLATATGYLKVGDTYIIANGKYGENMTQLDVRYDLTEAAITDATGIVYNVDDLVLGDTEVATVMSTYITMLDAVLTPSLGITYSATPIAHTTFDVPAIDFYQDPLPTGAAVEVPASLLVADAQYNAVNAVVQGAIDAHLPLMDPTFDASPFAAAFIENGAVRDPIMVGQTGLVAAADAFRTFPLGIGPDGVPGYPMMSFYITPREMKAILDLNVEVRMGNAALEYYMNPAGVRYIFDETRGQFDKVIAVLVCNDAFTTIACYQNGTLLDLTDTSTDNMLRVTVDYYVTLLLPEARNQLGENVSIDPKLKDGTVVDMLNGAEVAALAFDGQPGDYDENTGAPIVQELKAWVALILFVAGLEDNWDSVFGAPGPEPTDGIPSIPARIYDLGTAPSQADPYWQMGLGRGMEKVAFCAMVGNAYPFCPQP